MAGSLPARHESPAPLVQTRNTSIDGAFTSYLEAGDPAAPPVVLVHDGGYGSDAMLCWEAVIGPLAERYHVLAPDLLGFGGTAKLVSFDADPLTFRLTHLARFCDQAGVDRPALVGNSFGGAVVLNAAARRAVPLSRVVSICGTGGPFMIRERFASLQEFSPGMEAARGIDELMVPDPAEESVRARYERSLRPGHWEALTASRLRNPMAEPPADWIPAYVESLRRIETPVLFVAGADDLLLEAGWEQEMASIVPGAMHLRVDGARHQPHRSHPDIVVPALMEFLGVPR